METVYNFILFTAASPVLSVFWGGDNYWLPSSSALFSEDILATKGVSTMKRETMVEYVEDFHNGLLRG
jgi:hypothetical protein